MEGSNQNAQKIDPASAVGTLLCATRMRLGKDLQRIAEILHIRYTYLVAMEDGRYEDLPGQAYAIGFVRAYADHLGLDGDEIVRRYKEESSGLKNRPVFEFALPTPDSGLPSGALILVAVILGMMVYGVWYAIVGSNRDVVEVIQAVPDRLATQVNPDTPPAPEAVASSTEAAVASEDDTDTAPINESDDSPVDGGPADASDLASMEGPAPPSNLQTSPQVASAPAAGSAASAGPTVPADVVELRAKSDVWITLRTTENPDRTQLLHKGEVFRAPEGGGGMTLVTGKPTDLEILVNGEVMPPLDAGVFARGVPLDPQRLKGSAASAAAPSPARPIPGAGPASAAKPASNAVVPSSP